MTRMTRLRLKLGRPRLSQDPTDLADAITAAEWPASFLKHQHAQEAGRSHESSAPRL